MVEGRTLKVFLCCWIDYLAQAIREHREQKLELMGMRVFGFKEITMHVPVNWNISPSMDSKVFRWSEWFRSRTNERQRLNTLPGHRRYLECDASLVTLCTYNRIKHTNTSKLIE